MGSFLDKLLVGALGQLQTQSVGGGQSVLALPGQVVLADPSVSSPSVSAPLSPAIGAYFGVVDVTGLSGAHAINVVSAGAAFKLESPASAGTYSNAVTIATNGRARFWMYAGTSPGWKLIYGVL
jgi:hypothetical protein